MQKTGDERLVYDLITNRAYCLNETSAKVFNACGNNESFDDLKSKHSFTDDLIYLSLDKLKKTNLLAGEYDSPFVAMNRREVIRRVGLASMVALPVISSLLALLAAIAASGSACAGSCYAPNTNVCAGRAGQVISLAFYSSSNGSCTGNILINYSIQCPFNGDSVIVSPDVCVT